MELSSIRLKINPETGGWLDMGKFSTSFSGVRFRVRSLDSVDLVRMRNRLVNEIPLEKRFQGMDPADERRIMSELLAEALLEWDGIAQDGAPLPYDKELARTIITDPMNVMFKNAVAWACEMLQIHGETSVEADVKN